MSKHYYRKAIPASKIRDSAGEVIPFEALSTSYGFIELDDSDSKQKQWAGELDKMEVQNKGGVSRITEAQFAELYVQKKTLLKPLLPSWLGGTAGDGRQSLNPGNQTSSDTNGKRVNPAVVDKSKDQPTTKQMPVLVDPKPLVGKLPKPEPAAV